MNADMIQSRRYGLQKRVRRLATIKDDQRYLYTLRQFWHFLSQDPLYQGVLADLSARNPANDLAGQIADGGAEFKPSTEEDHVAVALALILRCLRADTQSPIYETSYRLGRRGQA